MRIDERFRNAQPFGNGFKRCILITTLIEQLDSCTDDALPFESCNFILDAHMGQVFFHIPLRYQLVF